MPDSIGTIGAKVRWPSHLLQGFFATTVTVSNAPQSGYIAGLDGMRAVSIALVFLGHYGFIRAGGMFGVQVFFVISGFIISRVLIREFSRNNGIDIKLFYIRRFLRLSPSLYLVVTLVVVGWTLLGRPLDIAAAASGYFYFSNYFQVATGSDIYSMPLWSLAVEEHFYILFPLLFSLWLGQRQRSVLPIVLCCALVLGWRIFSYLAGPGLAAGIYVRTDTRIDAILFGVALGVISSKQRATLAPNFRSRAVLATAFAGLAASYVVRSELFRATLMYTIQGASIACIMSYFLFMEDHAARFARRVLEGGLAVQIGRMSYALYLWHLPILVMVQTRLGASPAGTLLAGLLSLLLSFMSWRYVERPMLTVRRRFGSHAR